MLLTPIGLAAIECARYIMLLRNLINPRLLNAKFLFNLGNGVEVGDGTVSLGCSVLYGLFSSIASISARLIKDNLLLIFDALRFPALTILYTA